MDNNTFFDHKIEQFVGIYNNVVPSDFCRKILNIVDSSNFVDPRSTSTIKDRQLSLDAFYPSVSNELYQNAITPCLLNYCSYYPYLSDFIFVSSACLVQVTEPLGGGYHQFHAENAEWHTNSRMLVWMVYLNDVEDGETEFLYQGIKIKPKEGTVVIWPGSFTHLHRGNPPRNTKYIMTGWFHGVLGMQVHNVSELQK